MKRFLISFTVFFLFAGVDISAQILQPLSDSVYTDNFLSTDFENNSNSSNLLSRINFNIDVDKFRIYMNNRFTSDVTKLSEKFFRDYNVLEFITNYSLAPDLYTGVGVKSSLLSDDRNVEINKNNNNYFFTNVDFIPFPNMFVNSKLGYKSEEQIGEFNKGFRGELTSEFTGLNIHDYISDGSLNLSYEKLNPKVNYNFGVITDIYKVSTEKSDNKATVRVYDVRSDFYVPATSSIMNNYNVKNNIQTRLERYVYLGDEMRYFMTNNLMFGITGIFYKKYITDKYKYKPLAGSVVFENIYDSKVFENQLEANASVQYNSKSLYSKLQISYTERSESHEPVNLEGLTPSQIRELENIEKNKNNNSKTTTLILEAAYRLTNTHSFKFSGSSSILKYDTDSEENFDDRDEVSAIGSISHLYNNLRNFEIETTFEINYGTLRYLFEERSSNNNVNKIYKLKSRNVFAPFDNFLTVNSFEVLANYTVYDFEDLISQIQSFSYRQLSLRDSVFYNITRELSLELSSDIKIYEQGEFDEDNFSVRPLRYFDERKINSQVSYLFYDFLRISLGFSYFVQKTYEFESGEKILKSTFENYGPLGRISVLLNNNSSINVSASKDFLKHDDSSHNSTSETVLINVLWNI